MGPEVRVREPAWTLSIYCTPTWPCGYGGWSRSASGAVHCYKCNLNVTVHARECDAQQPGEPSRCAFPDLRQELCTQRCDLTFGLQCCIVLLVSWPRDDSVMTHGWQFHGSGFNETAAAPPKPLDPYMLRVLAKGSTTAAWSPKLPELRERQKTSWSSGSRHE